MYIYCHVIIWKYILKSTFIENNFNHIIIIKNNSLQNYLQISKWKDETKISGQKINWKFELKIITS